MTGLRSEKLKFVAIILTHTARALLAVPQKLRITSDSIRSAIRDLDYSTETPLGLSENGAIVMNPELLTTLKDSTRRVATVAGDRRAGVKSSFSSGAWTDFVKMGNKCFQVASANTLEPMSHEMWYRVKC